jgi:ferredoxin
MVGGSVGRMQMPLVQRLVRRMKDELRAAVRGRPDVAPRSPAAPIPMATAPTPANRPMPAPVPAAHVPKKAPPSPSGFAAAARAASSSGLSTAATFRKQAHADPSEAEDHDGDDTVDNGTADRIIGSIAYDHEIRIASDGARYAGQLDNPSARAKAAGDRLDIDRNECIGCGTCVEHIDTVFFLNGEEGKAYVIAQEGAMDRIEDAIDACPVTCISWQPA